jgi:hypothetical protein
MKRNPAASEPGWNTGGDPVFYRCQAARSGALQANQRFLAIQAALLKALGAGPAALNVAGIGCAAGTAARLAIALVRALAPLRLCAHVAAPYTVLLAFKPAA